MEKRNPFNLVSSKKSRFILPNLLTIIGVCLGISSIKFALDQNYSYKIFQIKNCRIYTDTVTDTAFIIDNRIINGPSFQHRNPKNAEVSENIVFQKGTPKLKKKLSGTVFSLLTGGGGNANYWH